MISPNRHCTIIGPNGVGKSVLARWYAGKMPSIIIVDSKHDTPALPGFVVSEDPKAMGRTARIVWRPPRLADPIQTGDLAAWYALQRGATCLMLDEAALVAPGQRMGPYLRAAIITGRSPGVGVWALTQRPKDVHNLFFTEAWAYFVSPWVSGVDMDKIQGFLPEEFGTKRQKLLANVPAEASRYAWYVVERGQSRGNIIRVPQKEARP
ncbi:MAG: hypothetical protein C7B46_11520 [Sulfobacillus benefaciens]|uniref:AAA+ ATPase domain-containing protein n=1 Tax=Sulfobacillus benefaciens TaxID=453960 RepID=A0A2T2XET6_9FIRM|nr:MAG: hypothetical protein C7B46_11520 [Sulfobacillus benefaciens]